MSKFTYKGKAEILHLNTRKEGPEDDKVLDADIKLQAMVSRSVLEFFEPMLGECLFLDSGAVRNVMMGPIHFENELRNYAMDVFGWRVTGVTVKKFVVVPKNINQILLTFSVSFKPTGNEVGVLAEHLADMIDIDLAPESGELGLGEKFEEKT